MSDPVNPNPSDDPATVSKRNVALAAAASLRESMAELGEEIRRLHQYGRRNRHLIWALAVSLTLDVVLSIVVAFIAVGTAEANSVANQNRQSQITTCEAGNQARAVSVQLWNYVLNLSEQNNPPPEKRQQIEQFRTYVAQAYAPRDCSAIAAGK